MARWWAGRTGWTILNILATNVSPSFPSPTHFLVPWRVVMRPTELTPGSGRSWQVIGRWSSLPRMWHELDSSPPSSHLYALSWFLYFIKQILQSLCCTDWWCHFYPEWGEKGSPVADQADRGQHRAQSLRAAPGMPRNGEEEGAGALVKTVKWGTDRCHQTTPTVGEMNRSKWWQSFKQSRHNLSSVLA